MWMRHLDPHGNVIEAEDAFGHRISAEMYLRIVEEGLESFDAQSDATHDGVTLAGGREVPLHRTRPFIEAGIKGGPVDFHYDGPPIEGLPPQANHGGNPGGKAHGSGN